VISVSGSEGVLEGVVGRIELRKWIELYERAIEREKQLEKELKRIRDFLEEAKKARYVIDVHKQEIKRQELEAELKRVKEIRVKLEWLATIRIKNGCWNPEVLKEYEFIRDLGLLNKIRKEQIEYMCSNCSECSLIRVKTPERDLPLEAVVKSRGLPYISLYKLIEIRGRKLEEMEAKEIHLGALTDEEKKEIEKRIRDKLSLSRNILNSIILEKRVPLGEKIVISHRKYGCHRKLPKLLPINPEPPMNPEIDSDPKAPDHFVEDVVAEPGEDGSYSRIYLSSKHGSEESE
jgi:hypothetical protein